MRGGPLDSCSLVSVATASQLVGGQVAQVSISATSAGKSGADLLPKLEAIARQVASKL